MHAELITEQEDQYLTRKEVEALIRSLSDTDIFRLREIANQYKYCLMDADELLNETIIVAASGNRNFPRTEKFIALLAETMWSIASNEKRKLNKKFFPIDDDPANDPILNFPDKSISVDDEVDANQKLNYIYELFKNDDDVTMLLMGLYDGLTPDEICETNCWNHTTYNSVRKRLRRKLNNHLPNGEIS